MPHMRNHPFMALSHLCNYTWGMRGDICMPALWGEEEGDNKGQSSFSQRLSNLQLAAVSLQRACWTGRTLSVWKVAHNSNADFLAAADTFRPFVTAALRPSSWRTVDSHIYTSVGNCVHLTVSRYWAVCALCLLVSATFPHHYFTFV